MTNTDDLPPLPEPEVNKRERDALRKDALRYRWLKSKRERDALRKDALRYRWLKSFGPALFINHYWNGINPLDSAIDAAMKGKE